MVSIARNIGFRLDCGIPLQNFVYFSLAVGRISTIGSLKGPLAAIAEAPIGNTFYLLLLFLLAFSFLFMKRLDV